MAFYIQSFQLGNTRVRKSGDDIPTHYHLFQINSFVFDIDVRKVNYFKTPNPHQFDTMVCMLKGVWGGITIKKVLCTKIPK